MKNRVVITIAALTVLASTTITLADKAEPIVSMLATPKRLLFDDDGSIVRGGKKAVKLNEENTVRAWAGKWAKSDSAWRSTWAHGMGHTPVVAYETKPVRNLIVEVTFRYGAMFESWHNQCFRITLDNRSLYTGHILSAWANPNNDFIETGMLLQHIQKKPDKTIVSDLLLDRQSLKVETGKWNTAILEIVGEEALFRMGTHVAYAKLKKLNVDKTKVALTLGKTWHEVKRVRVWEAEARTNPVWAKQKAKVLGKRKEFKAQPHDYKKATSPKKKSS